MANVTALSWISAVSTVLLGKTGTAVKVWTPVVTAVPDISTLPLISTVVAAICISVSATKSNWPFVLEWMYKAVS